MQLANSLCASFAVDPAVISVEVDAEPIDLGVHRAMPCALILNELMTNALKYAFPNGRKGEIRIGFVRFDYGEMELSCQDNGVGISEDFEWAKSKSLGFRIVKIIAKQIDGIFTLDRHGPGARFHLRLPARSN